MKKRWNYSLIISLLIIVTIVILNQNFTPHKEVSIQYIDSGYEDVKYYELAEIINDSVNDIDGYLTYQANDNQRYIYNPINKLEYPIPDNVKGILIKITNNNLIAVEYDYEQTQFIIQSWDFIKSKYSASKYFLEGPIHFEIIDTQYFEGSIFIALNDSRIIKINSDIQILTISDELKHYYENNTLIVYDEQLYINADRDIIYQYNKEKQQFQKLSPSPTLVTNVGIFKIENRNTIEIFTGTHTAKIDLPYISEDNSIHYESSYILLDSFNDSYLIGRAFDNLYLNSNNKTSVLSLNEPQLLGSFIDEKKLIYRKNNKLILLNIPTMNENKLFLDFSPITLKRFLTTENTTYFQLTDDKRLYILEFTTKKGITPS